MIGKIYNASQLRGKRRMVVAIDKKGRLRIIKTLWEHIGFECRGGLAIAPDTESKDIFYIAQRKLDKYAFRLMRDGSYLFARTSSLFDAIGIDYRKKQVLFDMTRCEEYDKEMGGECYKIERQK